MIEKIPQPDRSRAAERFSGKTEALWA